MKDISRIFAYSRRVWMPEFQLFDKIEDLLLFPMQNMEGGDTDSQKGVMAWRMKENVKTFLLNAGLRSV